MYRFHKKSHTIKEEKARGVIWQRHLYKTITYKKERKTFSEMVRKHRTRYASPENQGKGDKIARWEPMKKVLMQPGTKPGSSNGEIER